MAETYQSQDLSARSLECGLLSRIYKKIERELNENEYNRTEVQERAGTFNCKSASLRFGLNAGQGVRILDTMDSNVNERSYINQLAAQENSTMDNLVNL